MAHTKHGRVKRLLALPLSHPTAADLSKANPPATDQQKDWLQRRGIVLPADATETQARRLMMAAMANQPETRQQRCERAHPEYAVTRNANKRAKRQAITKAKRLAKRIEPMQSANLSPATRWELRDQYLVGANNTVSIFDVQSYPSDLLPEDEKTKLQRLRAEMLSCQQATAVLSALLPPACTCTIALAA